VELESAVGSLIVVMTNVLVQHPVGFGNEEDSS
jgi:hypothetical protein